MNICFSQLYCLLIHECTWTELMLMGIFKKIKYERFGWNMIYGYSKLVLMIQEIVITESIDMCMVIYGFLGDIIMIWNNWIVCMLIML